MREIRVGGLFLATLLSSACSSDNGFRCTNSSECTQGGIPGTCELASTGSQFCAFSDSSCSTGKRWGVAAGDGLASQCLEVGDAGPPDAPPAELVTLRVIGIGGSTENATFVAFQDGTGPWEAASGVDGLYELPITTGKYSVLVVCDEAETTNKEVSVFSALTSEVTELSRLGCEPPETATLSGTVTGIAGAQVIIGARASLGVATEAMPAYSMMLPAGYHDVLAVRSDASTHVPDSAILEHQVSTLGTDVLDLDFGTQGVPIESFPVSLTNGPAEISTFLFTNSTVMSLGSGTFYGLPLAELAASDVHRVRALVTDGASRRSVSRFVREAGPETLTLPEPLQASTPIQVATAPLLRLEFDFTPLSGAQVYRISLLQQSPGFRFWNVSATVGWLAGATSLEIPDPSMAAGWSSSWGLFSDSSVDYTISALFSTLGLREFLSVSSFAKREQDQWESSVTGTFLP